MKHWILTALALSTGGLLAAACGAPLDAERDELDAVGDAIAADDGAAGAGAVIGSSGQALWGWCENPAGVSGVMAGLAIAAAKELKRWQPSLDFTWNSSTDRLDLTAGGRARCADGACKNTQALLDVQKPEAAGLVRLNDGQIVDVVALRSTLKTNWAEQKSCDALGQCRVEDHEFRFSSASPSYCGTTFTFTPMRPGSSFITIVDEYALTRKLKFVGFPENDLLNFVVLYGGKITVDPTYGLNESGSTAAGSCDASCTKFSSSSIAGSCCNCGGVNKKFVRSTFNANMYLCQ